MLQHLFKTIRLTFTPFSFPIINRPQNHIFFVIHKKTENASDIIQGILIQLHTAIYTDIQQYQCKKFSISQTPSQFFWIYGILNNKRIDSIPSSAWIFQADITLDEFHLLEYPVVFIHYIFPAHVFYPHPS